MVIVSFVSCFVLTGWWLSVSVVVIRVVWLVLFAANSWLVIRIVACWWGVRCGEMWSWASCGMVWRRGVW